MSVRPSAVEPSGYFVGLSPTPPIGGGGIRTHDTSETYTRLPSERLRPLGHSSRVFNLLRDETQNNSQKWHLIHRKKSNFKRECTESQTGIRAYMKKLILLLAVCVVALGCSRGSSPRTQGKPTLLVSIPPYAYLAKKLGGDHFNVKILVSGSSNPHAYEPKPHDVAEIEASEIWFKIGEPFEEKISRSLSGKTEIINVNDMLYLLPSDHSCSHHDSMDLHTWLSPHYFTVQAEEMSKVLIKKYPHLIEEIEANYVIVASELAQLEKEIAHVLKGCEGDSLLVSHPAFAYFCRDFDLKQISIEQEGKEPTIKQVQNVIDSAIHADVKSVVMMPQYSNKGANLIAQEIKIDTCTIDPYSEDYQTNMLKLAHLISENQRAEN